MALTIVATPGASNANSYITTAELTAYIETRLHNSTAVTAAASATDTAKRALITATRLLDEQIEWEEGWPADWEAQALLWPRTGCYLPIGEEIADTDIPAQLKNACAELACYLIDNDALIEQSADGIAEIRAGSIGIRFKEGSGPQRKPIPAVVYQMIACWGSLKYPSGGIRSVGIERA